MRVTLGLIYALLLSCKGYRGALGELGKVGGAAGGLVVATVVEGGELWGGGRCCELSRTEQA